MKIIGREIPDDYIRHLVMKIKEKKELSGLDVQIVLEQLKKEIAKDSKLANLLKEQKKAAEKKIVKLVRDTLRKMHGTFNTGVSKRRDVLSRYIKMKDEDMIIDLIKTHKSSSERLDIYENLYHNIFEITEQNSSILDLGCGLNPLSVIFMDNKKINYTACDISSDDLSLISTFFKEYSKLYPEFSGNTQSINLFEAKKQDLFKKFQFYDICFLFKVLESIELSKSHKISENLILTIPADWIVVSFPKQTVSGRKMRFPRRGWFEKMLQRLKLHHRVLEYENEIFYIIRKVVDLETAIATELVEKP